MSLITVCLTNWKRPENLEKIIAQVRSQSVPVNIFLWNNGESIINNDIDWYVESSHNAMCSPRWFMAANADTEFVCIYDDDLFLMDNNIFADIVKLADKSPRGSIFGPTGVTLKPGTHYRDAEHHYSFRSIKQEDIRCDIIKGSMMLMRTSELQKKVNLNIFKFKREEDIIVSALMADCQLNQHYCLLSFGDRFNSVGDDDVALWRHDGHMDARELACNEFFPQHND